MNEKEANIYIKLNSIGYLNKVYNIKIKVLYVNKKIKIKKTTLEDRKVSKV